jgi:hypothetical protein
MSARRVSQRELDERRRTFLQDEEDRAHIEALLAEFPGEELGLTVVALSPALEFVRKRLNKVPHDDPQFNTKWKKAIVDLVASNVPLDPRTRSLLAGELRRLYFPNDERDKRAKRRTELVSIELYKQHLLSLGMTAAEADREIAASHGFRTVGALRKHMQRAQK